MVEDFYNGHLNLSWINYGLIVLIPKIKEATNIKQFRPLCMLNVFYKLSTKLMAIRLMSVAEEVISKTQTAFVKQHAIKVKSLK